VSDSGRRSPDIFSSRARPLASARESCLFSGAPAALFLFRAKPFIEGFAEFSSRDRSAGPAANIVIGADSELPCDGKPFRGGRGIERFPRARVVVAEEALRAEILQGGVSRIVPVD